MIINKYPNEMGTNDFTFTQKNLILRIIFAGNLDLYFAITGNQRLSKNQIDTLSFEITKKDYELYTLFNGLYDEIVKKDSNMSPLAEYKQTLLVDEKGVIKWLSDDEEEQYADSLSIIKVEDGIRLLFKRPIKQSIYEFKNPFGMTVRIRNSGSRYEPFNYKFMHMYNKLQDIDFDYHQMNIEEYLYTKKLKK